MVLPHIHLATEDYIKAGLDPDGYALTAEGRYTTMKGALLCLVQDCFIEGILDDDDLTNEDLFG